MEAKTKSAMSCCKSTIDGLLFRVLLPTLPTYLPTYLDWSTPILEYRAVVDMMSWIRQVPGSPITPPKSTAASSQSIEQCNEYSDWNKEPTKSVILSRAPMQLISEQKDHTGPFELDAVLGLWSHCAPQVLSG